MVENLSPRVFGKKTVAVVQEQQFQIAGPMREHFLRFSGSEDGYQLPKSFIAEDSTQFVTELQIPIQKK